MSNITCIGIDPGGSGAMAIIKGDKIKTIPFSKKAYDQELRKYKGLGLKKVRCVLELVHSMPGQGVKSTFSFGRNFGYIIGLLEANDIKYSLVSPISWKTYYHLIGKGKQASIDLVHKKFPKANLKRTNRRDNDDHNIAEAVLFAEYAKHLSIEDFHVKNQL